MSKQEWRRFRVSFAATLMAFAFFVMFLYIDTVPSRYEYRNITQAIEIEPVEEGDLLHYRVSILGNEFFVSLETLNELSRLRKQYPSLTTPHNILTAERLHAIGYYLYSEGSQWYRTYSYQKQVAAAEQEVPVESEGAPQG